MSTSSDGGYVNRVKRVEIGEAVFEVIYKPLACAIVTGEHVAATEENMNKFKSEYDGYLYFDLKVDQKFPKGDLLKEIAASAEEYDEIIRYCSFGISNDLKLVINELDTVSCGSAHFERSYGMRPGLTFLTVFPKPDYLIESICFVYKDKILKKGPVKFHYSLEEILEPEI